MPQIVEAFGQQIEFPDGMPPEQISAILRSNAAKLGGVKSTLPPLAADPLEGMSGFDKFRAGWGKSVADLGRGVGQYMGLVSRDDVAESRKRDAALMETGAGKAGGILGGMATLAPAAFIPGANTIAGAGAIGALQGALSPSASTGETVGNIAAGGAFGAAVPAGITALKVGKSFLEPLYQSGRDQIIGRAIRGAAGNQADDAMRALQQGRQSVPGSMPSAAEVAQNPGIAAMQRTAIAVDPVAMNEMAARQLTNNEARIAALQSIAGDRAASVTARDAATNALYAAANGRKINITPELEKLLQRPVMQSAMSEARTLAANEGRGFSMTAPSAPVPSPILSASGLPSSMTASQPGSMLGRDAHTIKMALDDTIEGLGTQGMARNAKRAAVGTKDEFLTALEAQAPEYGQARETFARLSKPINQADVAEAIMQRSTGNIQGNMTPAAFNRALNDRTAQSALGRKNATIEGTFTPGQMNVLNGLKADLRGLDFANSAGRGVGSDTVQKLAFSNLLNRSGMPEMVRGFAPASVAGNLLQKAGNVVYGDANKKMSEQLARSLLDPQTTAELMRRGVTPKGLLDIENGLIRAGIPLSGGLLGVSEFMQ